MVNQFSYAQQIVNHIVSFNSGAQNMWGPSFSPFTIDQEVTLFNQGWNVNYNTGSAGILNIAGQSFGGGLSGSFSGVLGSKIRIEGFTTGTVEVDYPVDIELNMPTDSSYDQGDNVTISSSYNCQSEWDLETLYPTAGEFFWDFYFQMAASASAQLCFFGCTTFPIIPSFDTGLQTLNLLTISASGASTDGETGIWSLGPGDFSDPFAQEPGVLGWPYSWPPQTNPQTSPSINFIPWQVYYGSFFPVELEAALGLSGEVTIPYVSTEEQTTINSNGDINACGDSTYFNINLEIFDLLGGVLSNVPGPVGAAGTALTYLSGSEEIGPAEVSWNFFSASFDANVTNKQCFDFTPKIYAEMNFPLPVDYSIINGNTGGVLSTGQSSIITFKVGDKLEYQYPCYYEEINITPTYTIDGNFRNHTFDEVTFDFLMSAFEFGFEIPQVIVIPGFTIPEICVPIPYPCPTWSSPFKWCSYQACTPQIVVPDLGFPGFNLEVGPLWDTSLPLGSFSYDWFDQTWELEGFSPVTMPPFSMKASPIQVFSTVNDVACFEDFGGSIEINISAESHAYPYSFAWSNGTNFSNNSATTSLSNIGAGQYVVDITDNNGCQLFSGATVNEPAELYLNYTKTNKKCGGGLNDGSIDLSVFGGTPPYTFNWSNGTNTQDLSGLNSGTYSVGVTDFLGCTAYLEVIITEPNPLVVNGLLSPVNCSSGVDGEIDITVYGGNLPYNYSWSSGPNTQDLSDLNAGTYTITVLDSKNCTIQDSFIIDEPSAPLSLSASQTTVSCYGESTGGIDIITNGGTPGYVFQWVSPINGVLPYFSEDLNNVLAGEYELIVTDLNECTTNLNIVVTQPEDPISSAPSIVNILCLGNNSGVIEPNVFGGNSSYAFNWSNGDTTQGVNGMTAGEYELTVTDIIGCSNTFSYTITEPEMELSTTIDYQNVACFGTATGTININAQGGTGAYSYQLNNEGGNVSNLNLLAGSYDVIVTDENLCTYQELINLTQPASPINATSMIENVRCFGQATGVIEATVLGGTSPYVYSWVTSDSVLMTNNAQILEGLSEGTYSFHVIDTLQCEEWFSYQVIQPDAPLTIEATSSDANCLNQSDGQIDLQVSGGTGAYNYIWDSGENSQNLISIPAGFYHCEVTDDNNCIGTVDIEINEPLDALEVSTEGHNVLCFGDSTGYINAIAQGGTAPYFYAWSNGATSQLNEQLSTGIYTVEVIDFKGCIAFSGATIIEPNALQVTTNVDSVLCHGQSNGAIEINVTGGIQPYYYNWGNQGNILLNNPSEQLEGLSAGDYFIRVTDKNNCTYEQISTVHEPELLEVSEAFSNALCYESTDGTISISFEGGTIPYSLEWNNGAIGYSLENLSAGTYQYIGTDYNNCRIENILTISQPEKLSIDIEMNPVSCVDASDGALYLEATGGTAPYAFIWTNGSTENYLENQNNGQYSILITDYQNCTIDTAIFVEIIDNPCVDIPNTFTPNGDNYNDTWVIEKLNLYPNYELLVFNKWGNEIYKSTSLEEEWDGTQYGKPLPSGVYYYILKLNNTDDLQYTGTITLIR